MQTERPYCSECGTEMSFRLGQYECPSCGHTQAPAAQPDPASTRRSPPPGSGSWDPGAQYRTQSSELPPPPMHAGGYASPGGVSSVSDDPLRIEKLAYIGIASVLLVINTMAMIGLFGSSWTLENPPGMLNEQAAAQEVGALAGSLINVVLTAAALLLREVWLKWTCAGCSGCSLLASIPVLLMANSVLPGMFSGGPGLLTMLGLLNCGWLVVILWRDIQNMNSGY